MAVALAILPLARVPGSIRTRLYTLAVALTVLPLASVRGAIRTCLYALAVTLTVLPLARVGGAIDIRIGASEVRQAVSPLAAEGTIVNNEGTGAVPFAVLPFPGKRGAIGIGHSPYSVAQVIFPHTGKGAAARV